MDARAARSESTPALQASPTSSCKDGAWQVVGAVVRGVSHERLGLPCQDAEDYRVLPGGTLLIALADGAGSAPFSDQGAQVAVNEALRALSSSLENGLPAGRDVWEIVLRDAFNAAREAVLQLAVTNVKEGVDPKPAGAELDELAEAGRLEGAADGSTIDEEAAEAAATVSKPEANPPMPLGREYASTLTCVVATTDQLIVGQIGDGVVVAGEGAELFAVTRLQRGEYANETHFLTQPDALDQVAIEVVDRPVGALAVMSDGLIRLALKMPAQQPHEPFFQPLFRATASMQDEAEVARQLAAFLGSERVNARTDDDKSLVLAVRVKSPRESGEQSRPGERTINNTEQPPAGSAGPNRTGGESPGETSRAERSSSSLDMDGE